MSKDSRYARNTERGYKPIGLDTGLKQGRFQEFLGRGVQTLLDVLKLF